MLRVLITLIIYGLIIAPCSFAKEYSGSAWTDDGCKYYNGSAWVDCTKNRYTGSVWEGIEATGTPVEVCVGFGAVDCVPGLTPTSNLSLTAPDYATTRWVATENGTGDSVSAYFNASTTTQTNVTLYKDISGTITRIGYGAITPLGTAGWTAFTPLTAYPGQSLDFVTGDILYYGVESNNDTADVRRITTGGTGSYAKGLVTWVSDTAGAGETISPTYTADHNLAIVFKYLK